MKFVPLDKSACTTSMFAKLSTLHLPSLHDPPTSLLIRRVVQRLMMYGECERSLRAHVLGSIFALASRQREP